MIKIYMPLILLYFVSTCGVMGQGEPLAGKKEAAEKAAEGILAEITPLVEDLLGKLQAIDDYYRSDLKEKIDEYSRVIRKREISGLLSKVDKSFQYSRSLKPGQRDFKDLHKFFTLKKDSLRSADFDFYDKQLAVLKKKKVSRDDLLKVEADLKRYASFLRELSAYVGKGGFVFVETDISEDNMLTENLSKSRWTVRLLGLRIRMNLAKGSTKEALQDARSALEFCSAMERSKGLLIHYLVALACKTIAADSISEILKSDQLSQEQLKSLLGLLKEHQSTGVALKDSLITEHRFIVSSVAGWDTDNTNVLKVQLKPATFFMDEKDLKLIDGMKDGAISREEVMKSFETSLTAMLADVDAQTPWLAQNRAKHAKAVEKQIPLDIKSGKLSAWLTYRTVSRILGVSVDKYYFSRNRDQALILATAIQLFEKKRSALPTNLEELKKEKVLADIPIDLGTGKAYDIDWKKRGIRINRIPQRRKKVILNF